MEKTNSFLTIPVAILIGSVVIGLSLMISSGVIKLGSAGSYQAPAPTAPTGQAPSGQAVAKTEADIIKGLKDLAKNLGLDQNKFSSCLDSGSKADLVKADLDEGSKVGVNGTPGFFVNGRTLSGAQPYAQFKTIIDEELSGSAPANTQRQNVPVGNLPVLGNPNAPVTIIEFSDYQCPFCEAFFTQTEPQIKKDYIDSGKVKFYYRDYPLSQIHPGAQKAAEAARCAGDQNKYWQYHDSVFQNQKTLF